MPNTPLLTDVTVRKLTPGSHVEGVYLLSSADQRTKKNGEPFYMLQLTDATGTVGGVMWDNHQGLVEGIIQPDNFVFVRADVGEYNNQVQVTVKSMNRVEDSEVDVSRFLPTSPRPRAEMEAELDRWIEKVTHPDCRRLLDRIFGHKRLRELYCTAPAAARIHQAYIHGLLDHTLNVIRIADNLAAIYEPVDRDILFTGALLHDIGKIRELDWRRTITYTTIGRLQGHISMGASMIDAAINELRKTDGFDEAVQMQIIHLILSHHGKLEYGSPVRPQTREAMVLHYADNTEAYMTVFAEETAKAAERGQQWTPFNRMFESFLFAGNLAEKNEGQAPSSEDLIFGDSSAGAAQRSAL